MRFAFVSSMSLYPWGGSEELWSQAASRLRTEGHTVAVSIPFWPRLSPRVTDLAEKGIQLHVHQSGQSSVTVRSWRRAVQKLSLEPKEFHWLRRQKPDLVVISQGGITDGLEWMHFCRKTDLPFVAISQCNSESWWPTDQLAAAMAMNYPSAQRVFCVSHRNRDLLEQQIACPLPNARIVRNPYNVSPNQAPPWPAENDVARLACVARLEPVAKGQDLLFQVLSRPQWRNRHLEVNLYGNGPSEGGLRRLAESLGLNNVRFHGHVGNVMQIWECNHLLVIPSRFEGLPLALVEAMFCERPTVVTDVGGNTELCLNEKTGFIVPAPTAEMLEGTMEVAWSRRTEWRKIGKAARARAKELIPADPVAEFCRQLVACVSSKTALRANQAFKHEPRGHHPVPRITANTTCFDL